MAEERIWGSEEFIDTLLRGDLTSDVVGLRNRFRAEFPEKFKSAEAAEKQIVAWWPYQQETQWPDTFPNVSLFWVQPTDEEGFYRHHKHPSIPDTLAWAEHRTIQLNVFGRTRPEMSELRDAAKLYIKAIGFAMWAKYRTRFDAVQDDGRAERNPQVSAFYAYFRFRVMISMQVSTT